MYHNFYEYVDTCFLEDKLSHAFLMESDDIEKTFETLISYLYSKGAINNKDYINNVNITVLEPDGKDIKVGAINNLQKVFSTKPVDNKYNIFIIKYANKMNASSANKILKFLEEPTDSIIGFLLTEPESYVLPTIKSRCQIFKIIEQDKTSVFKEETDKIYELLENLNVKNEILMKNMLLKFERAELIDIIQTLILKYDENLSKKLGMEITKKYSNTLILLNNILHMLKSNVNIELVLDKLCIESRN